MMINIRGAVIVMMAGTALAAYTAEPATNVTKAVVPPPAVAAPNVVTLKACADVLLDEDRPDNNMGASDFAAKVASFRARAYTRIMLVKFDLAGLASTNIQQATFRVFCPPSGWDHSIDASFRFFGMLKPWKEGSGVDTTGSITGDGASWKSCDGVNPWNGGSIVSQGGTNSLGNFDDSPFATRDHATYEEWLGKWIEVDASALARAWAVGARTNCGIAVCAIGMSTNNAYTMFATREFSRDGFAPGQVAAQLVIKSAP